MKLIAGVAELVDAQDLGSCDSRRGGSSPSTRTILSQNTYTIRYFMQIKTLLDEGLKKEFNVVVTKETVMDSVNDNIKTISKDIKIQGFRPGKVPVAVIKQRYMSNILKDVLEELVQETSQKLMQEQDVRPALQPTIEVVKFAEDSELEYNIKMEILPNITLPDFSSLTLDRLVCDVEDKDVTEYISKIAKSAKNFVESDKKSAELGDTVLIDYAGRIDNVAFDGGTAKEQKLELGSKTFIDGFEDQLVGSKVGDNKIVKVTFPAAYHVDSLAGKLAEFEVDVRSILVAEDAKIDDELAKKFGLESLSILEEKVKEQIAKDAELSAKDRLKKDLFDKLEEICNYPLPEGLVKNEFNILWNRVSEMKKSNPEFSEGKSDQELNDIYQKLSKRRVSLGLLLAEISKQEKIVADNDSIRNAMFAQARNYPGQEHMVMEFYRNNPEHLEQLKGPIIEDKAVDFILEKVKFNDNKLPLEKFQEAVLITEDEF